MNMCLGDRSWRNRTSRFLSARYLELDGRCGGGLCHYLVFLCYAYVSRVAKLPKYLFLPCCQIINSIAPLKIVQNYLNQNVVHEKYFLCCICSKNANQSDRKVIKFCSVSISLSFWDANMILFVRMRMPFYAQK